MDVLLGKLLHRVSVEFERESHVLATTTQVRARQEAEAKRESEEAAAVRSTTACRFAYRGDSARGIECR